ncbi:MAG TPA: ATP-binding protein [Gammaproteobacteria bacterium]|nr:ATP-binding protein [Gammaproteobacteria bacterium]
MHPLLPTLIEELKDTLARTQHLLPRQAHFPEGGDMAKVAIGMRRAGKTYFIFQKIHELINSGVPLTQILYINFEDERLMPMDQKGMGMLLDDFYTFYPENHQKTIYLFLDEVQNIEEWALVIRRFLDSKNVQIYLTGSSAKLLSKEIATQLRGRSLSVEIWPYNFSEYLSAHHIASSRGPLGKPSLDQMRQHFINYLNSGGFPGVQHLNAFERLETLQGYVETVILRDIVERHHVTNITLLRYLIKSLLKNFAAPFSAHKFYQDTKSQGYKIAKDTIYNYVNYIEEAYLIFTVPIFTESLRQQHTTPRKIYAIDSGLIQANTINFSENYGKFFENLIYLDLRRQNKDIFFYQTNEGFEIDFVTQTKQGETELIQVIWDKSDTEALAREQRALIAAQQELNLPGRIIDLADYLQYGI